MNREDIRGAPDIIKKIDESNENEHLPHKKTSAAYFKTFIDLIQIRAETPNCSTSRYPLHFLQILRFMLLIETLLETITLIFAWISALGSEHDELCYLPVVGGSWFNGQAQPFTLSIFDIKAPYGIGSDICDAQNGRIWATTRLQCVMLCLLAIPVHFLMASCSKNKNHIDISRWQQRFKNLTQLINAREMHQHSQILHTKTPDDICIYNLTNRYNSSRNNSTYKALASFKIMIWSHNQKRQFSAKESSKMREILTIAQALNENRLDKLIENLKKEYIQEFHHLLNGSIATTNTNIEFPSITRFRSLPTSTYRAI